MARADDAKTTKPALDTGEETPAETAPGDAVTKVRRRPRGELSTGGLLSIWAISVAAHSILFVVMFLVPWLAYVIDNEDDLPLPNAELIGEIEPTSFDTSKMPDFSEKVNLTSNEELKFEPEQFESLSDIADVAKPDLAVIGIGAGGCDFSKFGLKAGGDAAPSFFGQRVQGARRVVFVVDKSGSMTDTFQFVREELKRSVGAMRRSQKFHVIFFSSGAPIENPPLRLVSAIETQKSQFYEFLDGVNTGGGTHPEQAMSRAFEAKPDLIYFLTDGEFDRRLIDNLDHLNKDRRVRIFTIAYFNREGAELLEQIAREHRGEFTFVSENDIP